MHRVADGRNVGGGGVSFPCTQPRLSADTAKPDPTDPLPTVGAPKEPHASLANDADETAPSGAGKPKFGPPAEPGEVGRLGPYRVVKQLGAGGMGAVYAAIDTRLDRQVAMKVMLPEFAADRAAKERFLREAKAAAKIHHDNVVTVYEADERDGVPYIAMLFLQGLPLGQFLKQKGTPALAHVIRIGREAALGLAAAHELGLVHRDIKPANLWLEAPNGRVKVLDFGLAKPVGTEAELTRSGAVVGMPAYMSPEQARGSKVDARTDLFSLGAVLYRLCTGQNPFNGPNVMAVLMALGSDDPTPVRELNPSVSEPLAQLIHQLLAKKPEQRPQTATEVAKQLRTILDQMLPPGASAPVLSGSVPAVSAADVSSSHPVVVHPLPAQPPIVVPMQITAQTDDVFAHLGDEDAVADAPSRTGSAPGAPKLERKKGGKGLLIATMGAVLLAGVAVAVVVSQRGKKGAPEAKTPEPTPQPRPEPKPPAPKIVADADRKAAEWVLSVGGLVRVDGRADRLKTAAELPKERFALMAVKLDDIKAVTDAGLANLKDLKDLSDLSLINVKVSDSGLANLKDLKGLTLLWLPGTGITDAGLAHLKGCEKLLQLNLGNTAVTGAGLAHLADLKGLAFLGLRGTGVTDEGLANLKGCKGLTLGQLRVSLCHFGSGIFDADEKMCAVPGDMYRDKWWCASPDQKFRPHFLPDGWFPAARVPLFPTRREAEDAAALAFGKLSPKRRAAMLTATPGTKERKKAARKKPPAKKSAGTKPGARKPTARKPKGKE